MDVKNLISEYESRYSQTEENLNQCESAIAKLNKEREGLYLDIHFLSGALQALRRMEQIGGEADDTTKIQEG